MYSDEKLPKAKIKVEEKSLFSERTHAERKVEAEEREREGGGE